MRDESSNGPGEPLLTTEEERIRRCRLRVAELEATLDRIGAEAQARGLTEEILNEILNEELTAEEVALNWSRAQELMAWVGENRELARQRGVTEADVSRLISETREGRPR